MSKDNEATGKALTAYEDVMDWSFGSAEERDQVRQEYEADVARELTWQEYLLACQEGGRG
jgi:hypothetical protein